MRARPRGGWRGARDSFERLASSRHVPVYRSSYALILTTVSNAVLGLLFWIAAARLYPVRVVGLGAGGISALQLVALIGWVGLHFTLLRYLPVAGTGRRRLALVIYAVGVAAASIVAVAFTSMLSGQLKVRYLSADPLSTLAFCASVAVWVVFTLQDSVLIGLRRAGLLPWENLTYGVLKLALLVVLSAIAEPWTLLGVWVGGAVVLVAVVSGLLFLRLLPATADPVGTPPASAMARFSLGHTGAASLALVPDFLVPLLILAYLDAQANAYYYAAWTVSLSTRLVAANIADALTVEAAYGQESVSRLLRAGARLCAVVLAPVIVVLILGAGLLLRVFGSDYGEAGAGLLRYFALSLVPFTVVTLAVALDRVRERFSAALLITATASATTIGLDVVLIPKMGIAGAGLGWLCGQTLAALVGMRTLRLASQRPASPGMLVSWLRYARGRGAR